MKKHLRMIYGIIMHPIRIIAMKFYRERENEDLFDNAMNRTWHQNHERMHYFSEITNTAYTGSELYKNLYRGCPGEELVVRNF